jgi:hypothetical protein
MVTAKAGSRRGRRRTANRPRRRHGDGKQSCHILHAPSDLASAKCLQCNLRDRGFVAIKCTYQQFMYQKPKRPSRIIICIVSAKTEKQEAAPLKNMRYEFDHIPYFLFVDKRLYDNGWDGELRPFDRLHMNYENARAYGAVVTLDFSQWTMKSRLCCALQKLEEAIGTSQDEIDKVCRQRLKLTEQEVDQRRDSGQSPNRGISQSGMSAALPEEKQYRKFPSAESHPSPSRCPPLRFKNRQLCGRVSGHRRLRIKRK